MKIKVCGMKYEQNILDLVNLSPDFMGFIFYEKSKRFVGDLSESLIQNIPDKIKKVGVFVNETVEKILELHKKYSLDYIQLHGNETIEYCKILTNQNLKLIKAFGVSENFDFNETYKYSAYCDFFIFDTKTPDYGGSGQKFDWNVINNYKGETNFLLSGGISEQDFDVVLKQNHQNFFGVDINSKFEIEPALKNIEKIKNFVNKIKNWTTEYHGVLHRVTKKKNCVNLWKTQWNSVVKI